MKKLFIFLVIWTVLYYLYSYYKSFLGDGYRFIDFDRDYWQYIINEDKEGIDIPIKVVEYDFDDNYIIATRIVVEVYDCCKKEVIECNATNSISMPTIYQRELEYWLVDKKKDIGFYSKEKSRIEEKLKEIGSKLQFSDKDYSDESEMREERKSRMNDLDRYNCVLQLGVYGEKTINLDE